MLKGPDLTLKYCPLFGQVALARGFISLEQSARILAIQYLDRQSLHPQRKTFAAIAFEQGWMNGEQIEVVFKELLQSEMS